VSTATLTEKRKKYRFKLLRGRHSQMEPVLQPDGSPVMERDQTGTSRPKKVQRFYAAVIHDKKGQRIWGKSDDPKMFQDPSDVVESDQPLDEMLNDPSGAEPKFQRIHEDGGGSPVNAPPASLIGDGLEAMTVKQLLELAAGEEIDLGGETKKADIIELIRASR